MSGFYSAMNKVFDEAEARMPRMSIAESFDSIDAELTVMAQHTVTRYSSGTGLDDWCQMRCSCLWAVRAGLKARTPWNSCFALMSGGIGKLLCGVRHEQEIRIRSRR